ncbi:hypothetical protein ACB092_04G051200 [Castanea dentata]
MLPSLFLKMLPIAAVALLLASLPSYEARKILQNPMKKNQDQVPSTFVPVPNPLSQKALAGDQINVSSLLGGMDWAPHVPVPPSAPNPGTYIPSSAMRQTKNPPHPSMLHNAYHVSPPNPSTRIIPPSITTSHNTAPLLVTPQMSPQPLSVNTAPLPQKSPLLPSVNTAPLLGTPQKSPLPPLVSNRGTSIPWP